jgi:hypothetical protein
MEYRVYIHTTCKIADFVLWLYYYHPCCIITTPAVLLPPLLYYYHPCCIITTPAVLFPPLLFYYRPCCIIATPAVLLPPLHVLKTISCKFNHYLNTVYCSKLFVLELFVSSVLPRYFLCSCAFVQPYLLWKSNTYYIF